MKNSTQKTLRVVGISRDVQFSPHHANDDQAILSQVVFSLRKKGIYPRIIREKALISDNIEADLIFHMARDERSIERLKELERNGVVVINSAYGIENCNRGNMTRLLIDNKIPHPVSSIVDVFSCYQQKDFPCWVKRADSHTIKKSDVSYVINQKALDKVFSDFSSRGIHNAVINEHLQGDLIKFYGVRDTDFFYWFYPSSSSCSYSKFGLEEINGIPHKYDFSIDDLIRFSNKASQVLNVPIYGGDCIVSEKGEIKIIDFNDWPSFARCKKEAGDKIAEYLFHMINELL